jgi:hypothetical protein
VTRDDIIRMAREAGFGDGIVEFIGLQVFERFFHMAQAAEREACAKVAFNANTYIEAAAAIRAREQVKDEMPLFDDWGKKW